MTGDIWVLAENWRGEATEAAFETLALGRDLADGLGVSLVAVLMGSGVAAIADQMGVAEKVMLVETPDPIEGDCGVSAVALSDLIGKHAPLAVLIPLTNASWDLAGSVPALADVPFVNSCRDLLVEESRLHASSVLFGGKIEATVGPIEGTAVFGVLPGARRADAGRRDGTPSIDQVVVDLRSSAVRFREYLEPDAGDVDITRQDVLVAVGRGLQGEANLELAEEIAGLLGGAVCGSRPAIDQGWLPPSRQVGKSGMKVKPKLYLALGISGAPEHVEGMRDADLVIAINTDPDAPIFRVAHFGVEADVLDVAEELIDRLEAVKSD